MNHQHQRNFQLKLKNKEQLKQLEVLKFQVSAVPNYLNDISRLQSQVQQLQMQLADTRDMLEKERMDKEHTTIAYRRILNKYENEKKAFAKNGGNAQ